MSRDIEGMPWCIDDKMINSTYFYREVRRLVDSLAIFCDSVDVWRYGFLARRDFSFCQSDVEIINLSFASSQRHWMKVLVDGRSPSRDFKARSGENNDRFSLELSSHSKSAPYKSAKEISAMHLNSTTKIIAVVAILLVIFIILILLSQSFKASKIAHAMSPVISDSSSAGSSKSCSDSSSSDSERPWAKANVQAAPIPIPEAKPVTVQNKPISAPVLRCYDYFEFPKEGGFHVKTCGIPSSPSPKKLFIQWFPVDGASGYNVYLNKGASVDTANYQDRWTVSASSHYFESDTLDAQGCWSMMVTALNDQKFESPSSKIYTTCSE
jgi:hypothetical protein